MKKNIPNDDEYEDSYSILGSDDGQEALESLIEMLEEWHVFNHGVLWNNGKKI